MKCPKCKNDKIIDYGLSGIGEPYKECLRCGFVAPTSIFKTNYNIINTKSEESKDDRD